MNQVRAQISIVIPVFNRAGVVGRTLASVVSQSVRPLRVVLVDNGSTDGSGDVLRRWACEHCSPDLDVLVLDEPRPGAACARNCGLRAVDTPWTMFFDSDDEMLPGHVARVLEAVSANPEVDLFGWDVKAFGADGCSRILPFEPHRLAWHSLMHGSLSTLRYCARTELFRSAGGWCERLGTWDDIELGCRLLCLRPHVMKLQGDTGVVVHYSAESVSGPSYAASMEKALMALREIEKSYAALGPLSHVRLKQVILAADCVRDGRQDAAGLLADALAAERSFVNRLVYRAAYCFRIAGGRGAARLFKPLLR